MIDNLITIYDKNDANNLTEHLYDTQGLGALSDWLTATVTNKLNGAEIFQGTYPINGTNSALIIEGRIIQCYVDENREKQRLRIYYAKTSGIGNTIEVKAEPIFNDIRKSVLNKYDTKTGKITASQAWKNAKFLAKPSIPSKFSFISLVNTLASVKIEKANFLEFFGGKEGSILDRFHGEFLKDNNTLRHEKRLGTDHKIKAIYTKNLIGLDLEIDAQSVLVGIYPFVSSSSEGEDEITLPEEVIFTDYADDYPAGYISFVDFKDKASDVVTLREDAKEWLKTNVDKQKPQVSGSIELVPLRHQRGYEKFVNLEKISMGDGVDVYHPQLKVNMSARIVEYTFNVLTNSYDKLVVGNVKTNFLENTENNVSNLINDAIDQLKSGGEISDLIIDIVDHQTDLITGNSGGHVLLDPKEAPSRILVMDTPDKNTSRNVLQINNAGIGFSKTGINGKYETAWTLDGGFNASFITAGEIMGITIRGSILISESATSRTEISNGEITTYTDNKRWSVLNGDSLTFYKSDGETNLGGFYRTIQTQTKREQLNLSTMPNSDLWLSYWDSRENAHKGTLKIDGDSGTIILYKGKLSGDLDGNSKAIKNIWLKDEVVIPNNTNINFYSDLNMNGYRILNQSDIRLKENIIPTEIDPIKETKKLNFYEFDRKQKHLSQKGGVQPSNQRELGLIAQYSPFLVERNDDNNYLSINVNKQIMLNTMTNKALITKIELLEREVEKLKNKKILNKRKYHRNR